jgi:hypothetical protein
MSDIDMETFVSGCICPCWPSPLKRVCGNMLFCSHEGDSAGHYKRSAQFSTGILSDVAIYTK